MNDKQHPYLINIPKGYQYCPECELLTPHSFRDSFHGIHPEDYECDICTHRKDGYTLCPRCGWEHDPDRDIAPVTIKVKNHTEICCEAQNAVGDQMRNLIEDNCECPEVDCYPIQHIFNYRSTPAHWNMECPNAMEWSYDVMCKICNYVFEVEDGNC